jgi:hypothetical protein
MVEHEKFNIRLAFAHVSGRHHEIYCARKQLTMDGSAEDQTGRATTSNDATSAIRGCEAWLKN